MKHVLNEMHQSNFTCFSDLSSKARLEKYQGEQDLKYKYLTVIQNTQQILSSS